MVSIIISICLFTKGVLYLDSYWEKANHSWTTDSLRFINTPSKKTREMLYYIQEIGCFKAFKPYFTERENLDSFLVKYTVSGSGRLLYNDTEYILNKGDIFFIDCSKYQYYETYSSCPWEMDWIHFNGGHSSTFFSEYTKDGLCIFHSEDLNIHNIIQKLLILQPDRNSRTDFSISLLIHELLNELLIQKNRLDFHQSDIPDYIIKVKQYLDTNINYKISLEMLERMFLINRYQLVKDYSKYIGISPIDYLINNRISLAKDLLRYSSKPITEIAAEAGISNPTYFSRIFKDRTGTTPLEYRKNS
jgi:Transcriptional regulator containing an amidase domain and an AraC-type DNA-binding HTH domain